MKRLSLVGITVFVLFIFLGGATVSVQAATLNITVTDAQTGNKLNNASITVTPVTGDTTKGVSDVNGAFTLGCVYICFLTFRA